MRAFKTIFVAGATLLSLMSGALAQSAEEDLPSFERMVVGQVRIMKTVHPFQDVLVGASDVADITPITDQRIAITAKKVGMTSLMILGADRTEPAVHVAIQVVPQDQYKKTAIEVRSIRNGHTRKSYWCEQSSGCAADEKNLAGPTVESVTVVNLPGIGSSTTRTSVPVSGQQ